jgi:hypothetical protein
MNPQRISIKNLFYKTVIVPTLTAYISTGKNIVIPAYNGYQKSFGRIISPAFSATYRLYKQNFYEPFAAYAEKKVFGDLSDVSKWSNEKLARRMQQFNNIGVSCSLISLGFGIGTFFNPLLAAGSMVFSPLALEFSTLADRFGKEVNKRQQKHTMTAKMTGEDTSLEENVFKEISKDLIKKFNLSSNKSSNEKKFDDVLEYIESVKIGKCNNSHLNSVVAKLGENIGKIPIKDFVTEAQKLTDARISEYTRYTKWGTRSSFLSSLGTTTVGTIVFCLSLAGFALPQAISAGILAFSSVSILSCGEVNYCGGELKALERVKENLTKISSHMEENASQSNVVELSVEKVKQQEISQNSNKTREPAIQEKSPSFTERENQKIQSVAFTR